MKLKTLKFIGKLEDHAGVILIALVVVTAVVLIIFNS